MNNLIPRKIAALLLLVSLALYFSGSAVAADTNTTAPVPPAASASQPTVLSDHLILGDESSEKQHTLQSEESEVDKGLLDQPARRLLPGGEAPWEGGKMSFIMKVDPKEQNYFTARFSGDESNENYLILFCEGKQLGYRHLGDIDVLALPAEAPVYSGRFFYVTTPLPVALTQGKSEIHLEIRATGPIWGYGGTFDKYQKSMTQPSSGIYEAYTHTDGSFVPPAIEKQGDAPASTLRTEPGPEVMDSVKERVKHNVDGMMKSTEPLNQMQVQFLAKAYGVKWTSAYGSQTAVDQVVKGIDQLYARWSQDPNELWHDKATWNPGWFGVGPAGDAVRRLAKALASRLDEKIDGGKTRREAWSAMFQASCDWLTHNRRWLTNQSMFTDTNFYLSNRAVEVLDPKNAVPEEKALDCLYQALGMVPWLGKETSSGPEKPFGDDFHQITEKGLTRELGYAGGYGEVGTGGAMEIYEATREPNGEGDPKIKAQLIKMLRARAAFRYPMSDDEGHPAMRLETIVGWRDTHVPGNVIYVQPASGEQSPLRGVAATLDPQLLGYAQEMFADNQFFASVASILKNASFRNTLGLLGLPDEYDLVKAQAASPSRLPMAWDQPDYVFSDEEDGVVAIKNGHEILYASLYWRAQYGINFLARTHYLTPHYQQVAVVHEDVQFNDSGKTYTRPDWINFGFGNGGVNIKYPPDIHQALAGDVMPEAKSPADLNLEGDAPNRFSGIGEFYTLRYGPYLIGMNMSKDKTFDLQAPKDAKSVRELVSKRDDVAPGSIEKVGPQSTVVFYCTK